MDHIHRCCLTTLTFELLHVLNEVDTGKWAKTSKITWEVFGGLSREEELVCVNRYWQMVEEGWFSDSE